MLRKHIDGFLAQVDAKFVDQTPPNGPDNEDPLRLTVGLTSWPGLVLVTYIMCIDKTDWLGIGLSDFSICIHIHRSGSDRTEKVLGFRIWFLYKKIS